MDFLTFMTKAEEAEKELDTTSRNILVVIGRNTLKELTGEDWIEAPEGHENNLFGYTVKLGEFTEGLEFTMKA